MTRHDRREGRTGSASTSCSSGSKAPTARITKLEEEREGKPPARDRILLSCQDRFRRYCLCFEIGGSGGGGGRVVDEQLHRALFHLSLCMTASRFELLL